MARCGGPTFFKPVHSEERQQPRDDQVDGGDDQERVRQADPRRVQPLGGGDRDGKKGEDTEEGRAAEEGGSASRRWWRWP